MRRGNSIGTIPYAVTLLCIYVLCLTGCASSDDGGLTIITSSLPDGTVNQPYSTAVSGSGGLPPYTWSVTPALPDNLSFNTQTGAITGTPLTVETTPPLALTFTLQDSLSPPQVVQKTLTLTINPVPPPPTITTTSPLPCGTLNLPYTFTLTATGGVPPLAWTVIVPSLPVGLTLSSGGTISGTPTTTGPFNFTVLVKDALTQFDMTRFDTQDLALTIAGALTITTTSLPNAKVGNSYNTTLQRSGVACPPLTWSVAPELPPGLNLNASTGTISGTPATGTAGDYSRTFTVQDSLTPTPQTANKVLSLKINP
jgi:Putative Ig domain